MISDFSNSTGNDRTAQATDFVAAVYSGMMTPEQEDALNAWLAESPENLQEYQKIHDTWHSAGALSDSVIDLEEMGEPASTFLHWKKWATAAVLLLTMAVGVNAWFEKKANDESRPQLATYQTGTGERRTIDLEDGSRLTLNTNTRLLVDFSDLHRRVILNRGEVYFEVAHDMHRPFSVDTGGRAITVLGTKFGVQKAGFKLNVAVTEGAVSVHHSADDVTSVTPLIELQPGRAAPTDDRYRLAAGVKAEFSGTLGTPDAKVEVSAISDMARYPDWRFGVLKVRSQPLKDVVRELNRYTVKKILIEDSQIMDLEVSGIFKIDAIDVVLKRFEQALPLQVIEYPDRIVITGRG